MPPSSTDLVGTRTPCGNAHSRRHPPPPPRFAFENFKLSRIAKSTYCSILEYYSLSSMSDLQSQFAALTEERDRLRAETAAPGLSNAELAKEKDTIIPSSPSFAEEDKENCPPPGKSQLGQEENEQPEPGED